MDFNNVLLIDNLFFFYDNENKFTNHLIFRLPLHKEYKVNEKDNIDNIDNIEDILISTEGKQIEQDDEYLKNVIILQTSPFVVDIQGYQLVYIALIDSSDKNINNVSSSRNNASPKIYRPDGTQNDASTKSMYYSDGTQNNAFSPKMYSLILQMDANGKVQSLLQDHIPQSSYRVLKTFIFHPLTVIDNKITEIKLKSLPVQYLDIVNEFTNKHLIDNINGSNIDSNSLLKLQNSNVILFYDQLIDINILSNLDYDFLVYLSSFSPYMQKLISSEQFLIEYITKQYGRGILNEKPTEVSYKEWLQFILRNDNISIRHTINDIIKYGKYHLLNHLIKKHKLNKEDLDTIYVGQSQNMRIVDLYQDEFEKLELKYDILTGAAKTNPQWFETLLNKFSINNLDARLLTNAISANNLTMVKYLQEEFHLSLTDAVNINDMDFPDIDVLIWIFSENKKDDCFDLISYLYETVLNINFFRTTTEALARNAYGLVIENKNGPVVIKGYLNKIKSLAWHAGMNGYERTVDYVMNDIYIEHTPNGEVEKRGLNIIAQLEMESFHVYMMLLTGLCQSGNINLFRKYLNIFRRSFPQVQEIQNDEFLLRPGKSIVNIENVLRSGSINTVKYFDSLGLISQFVDVRKIGIGHITSTLVEPTIHTTHNSLQQEVIQKQNKSIEIVYHSNEENFEVFDYLAPIFLKEVNIEKFTLHTYLSNAGIFEYDIFHPQLFELKNRGLIDPIILLDIILKQGGYMVSYVENIIWIFRLKQHEVITTFSKISLNDHYPAREAYEDLVEIGFLSK